MSAHAAASASTGTNRAGTQSTGQQRIVELLARYPNLSCAEAGEILSYLKRARYLEIERLRSHHSVKRQLDSFMKGHRHALRLTASEVVAGIALVIAFLATCWLLWQALAMG